MKLITKIFSVSASLMVVFLLTVSLVAADTDEVNVTVDGIPIIFDSQGPAIVDGRTLVPVRGVFETMGFDVGWDDDTQTVALTRDSYAVTIIIDHIVFAANGVGYELDVPAQIIGGRTMLPIRAVLESVGYSLDWDGDTMTVIITSGASEKSAEVQAEPVAEAVLITEPFDFEVGSCFRAFAQGPAAAPMPIYIVILENSEFEVWSGSPVDGGTARSRGTFTIDEAEISFSQLSVLPAEEEVPEGIEAYVFTVTSANEGNEVTSFSIDNGVFRWPLPTMPPVTGNGADEDNNSVGNFVFNFVEL